MLLNDQEISFVSFGNYRCECLVFSDKTAVTTILDSPSWDAALAACNVLCCVSHHHWGLLLSHHSSLRMVMTCPKTALISVSVGGSPDSASSSGKSLTSNTPRRTTEGFSLLSYR
jgi:hypothetical protein